MELLPGIREILNKRGIVTEEEIKEYLSDKPQKSYDPFLLHNMEEGVDLILSSIENGERICIYGDYDTDGVTSVALLRDVLLELGGDVSYYIPSRFDEGYGLNSGALDKIKDAGANLVITVDCGSTSVSEVEHAKEIGLEILITDHHTMKDEIPDCLVINPKHPKCNYPFKSLAGVGVAFKLASALVNTVGLPKSVLTRNLDLAAIGTVGDIVPLIDENRTLVKYGLVMLNHTERPGLLSLMEKVGLKRGSIKSEHISFIISPHLNAAGRMENATLSARLLQSEDLGRAKEMADLLVECNNKRKTTQGNLLKEAEEYLRGIEEDRKFVFVELRDAHEGVIGIVAGRLKEIYSLPTVIVTSIDNEYYKGTGRSPDGIDLFEILNKHRGIFERFGGHAAACGFTIHKDNIRSLEECLRLETEELYKANSEPFMGITKPEIILDAREVSFEFIKQQEIFEPTGKNNTKPVVGVKLNSIKSFRMGEDGKYLRLVGDTEIGQELKAVDFKKADQNQTLIDEAMSGDGKLTAVGNLETQEWNDNIYLQMQLKSVIL